MIIYPKIDEKIKGIHSLKKYIDIYKGVELKLLEIDYKNMIINYETPINILKDISPSIKEVTINMPSSFSSLEYFFFENLSKTKKLIKDIIKYSNENKIKINILFTLRWNYSISKILLLKNLKDLIKLIEGTKVTILFENVPYTEDTICTPLLICDEISSNHLKVCFDFKHFSKITYNMEERFSTYVPTKYKKYIYQIHLSDTDNYINTINKYKLNKKIFIVSVKEEDYSNRINQVKIIEHLEKKMKNE